MVDEGAWTHVYKCLDNASNAYSTSTPTFAHITGSNTSLYQTADGYKWKYLWSVASASLDKFSNENDFHLFPIFI